MTHLTQFLTAVRIFKLLVVTSSLFTLTSERLAFLNVIQGIDKRDKSLLELSDSHNVKVLPHGRKFLDI